MMKLKRQHWVISALVLFLLTFVANEVLSEYLKQHLYYFGKNGGVGFFESGKLWMVVIYGLLFSLLPIGYLRFTKKIKAWWLGILLYLSLFIFGMIHMGHKGDIMGGSGTVMFAFNMLFFQSLATYFVMFVYGLGTTINDYIFGMKQHSWTNVLLTRGIGLGSFLLLNHFLILLGLFHPAILWIYFVAGAGLIRWKWRSFGQVGELFQSTIDVWKGMKWAKYLIFVVLMFSLVYLMFGLQLSFIPYSTAWDANHAYMFIPKVFATNGGYMWNGGPAPAPFLWLSYIAFRFGLFLPFGNGWLAPDTVAVVMNFFSGILVLVFGVVTIKELLTTVDDRDHNVDDTGIFLGVGWFWLLLWLTSGMGAFLVFVDNKTDLGVLSLVILAVLSGLTMIRHLHEESDKVVLESKNTEKNEGMVDGSKGWLGTHLRYVILSGIFFALAVAAKPTAFVDVFTFVLYFSGLFFGVVSILGLSVLGLGIVSKIGILNSGNMLHQSRSIWYIGIGVLGFVPEIIRGWMKKVKKYFFYFVVRGISLIISIIIIKSPHVLYKYFHADPRPSMEDLGRSYLMGLHEAQEGGSRHISVSSLLTTTESVDKLVEPSMDLNYTGGNDIVSQQHSAYIPRLSCSLASEGVTSIDELYDRMKDVQGGALEEDVGRYVGFGQKYFSNNGIGGFVLGLLYPQKNHCYTTNDLAKYLCEHRKDLSKLTVSNIEDFQKEYTSGSSKDFLNNLLGGLKEGTLFESDIVDQLNNYWTNRVVLRDKSWFAIPYRYIIPLNVVQNRSLQNESSYYTDIGFVWIISLFLLLASAIYSLLIRDRKLFAISIASIGGWALWIVIGGGIVWYGLGLIVWLIFVNLLFFYRLFLGLRDEIRGRYIVYGLLGIFSLWGLYQRGMNMTRIAYQGGEGPFVYYKQGVGMTYPVELVNGTISQKPVKTMGFNQDNVFDLQFGHYHPFLDIVEGRDNEDGIYIAGTYAEYFLDNYHNIIYDGMVSNLWKWMSDEDVCASYLRLKDKKIRYIVIDPNIATVVMGKGNSSLFGRFLVKVDNGKRLSNGVMAQIAEMVMADYMELLHTNNLGIKYAYTLSSEDMPPIMKELGETDEVLCRTKLSSARFFRSDGAKYHNVIAQIFIQRLQNGDAIQDIADIFGKMIDDGKVRTAVALQAQQSPMFVQTFNELTQDERFVAVQYINLLRASHSNQNQFQQMVQGLLKKSLSSGSQIAVWKLKG